MGFNTTVVIHNDALEDIAGDPDFGKNLKSAILSIGTRRVDRMEDVHAGHHCNVCEVIETHHADQVVAVAVGGNMGVELGYAGSWREMGTEDADKVAMLKTLALNLGYNLHKMPTKGKVKV